ncbi:MAG: hypothetical protein Ta2G_14580 [Termitinemataceae bacterium]|nr:MAG: hypothetical protein Ta2G_14580 [Termitinemataceae bacterium]
MEDKKDYRVFIVIAIFVVYTLIAAEPIPPETVLAVKWIRSLEAPNEKPELTEDSVLTPFELGDNFGFVERDGQIVLNEKKKGYLSMSSNRFAEYYGEAEKIEIKDTKKNLIFTMNNLQAYPFFLQDRNFMVHKEQNCISELDNEGNILWTYFFSSAITCVDASQEFLVCGTLDGTVFLLNKKGALEYSYEPSGSRIACIYGCAISKDGTKFAVISGIDKQRFVFFEYSLSSWRVRSHEFLDEGFRRPVNILFINNDTRIAYERENAVGIYEIEKRKTFKVPIKDRIEYISCASDDSLLFLVSGNGSDQKTFTAIKEPQTTIISAPFTSKNSFLSVEGKNIVLGGNSNLSSFEIVKK